MVRFVPIVTSLLLISLFIIAFVGVGLIIASDNNSNQTIGNDASLTSFNGALINATTNEASQIDASQAAFSNSSITTTGVFPYVNAVGGIWKTLKTTPILVYNLTIGFVLVKILGSTTAAIVTTILASILAIVIISAVVLWITRGEGG
jgi:hypothetical protein